MTKQVKVYAGDDTLEKWQKICHGFSSNTAAFAAVVENYSNQINQEANEMGTGNLNQIAQEIVDGALAHGTSTAEFIENCGDLDAAVDEIVRFYTEDEGRDAEFENVYGEPMSANSAEFRRYVETGLELN